MRKNKHSEHSDKNRRYDEYKKWISGKNLPSEEYEKKIKDWCRKNGY